MPRRAPISSEPAIPWRISAIPSVARPRLRSCSTENTSGKCCLGRKLMFLRWLERPHRQSFGLLVFSQVNLKLRGANP
jgi:hypothetical protein